MVAYWGASTSVYEHTCQQVGCLRQSSLCNAETSLSLLSKLQYSPSETRAGVMETVALILQYYDDGQDR